MIIGLLGQARAVLLALGTRGFLWSGVALLVEILPVAELLPARLERGVDVELWPGLGNGASSGTTGQRKHLLPVARRTARA